MSITVEEKFGSPQITEGLNPTATREYLIRGTEDENEALSALLAVVPGVYQFLALSTYGVEPLANGLWSGVANYSTVTPNTEISTTSFDTTGGSQHITQSLQTIGNYAPDGVTPPDFGGAIGVTADGVAGVDITVPAFKWSELHHIVDADDNAVTYRDLTGCVNKLPFRGFATYEVLFLGAGGFKRSDTGKWEVQFSFVAGRNRENFNVGSITVGLKRAWDYLWVRYEDTESEQVLVKQPASVHVEEVFPFADFDLLGI